MAYKINWTNEKEKAAISMLTKYFEEYGVGECIMQSDNACIYAPDLLSKIADDVLIEGDGIEYIDED